MEEIRKSNNLVKRSLIEHICKNRQGLQVLDVGCGCGGDLFKWKAAGARVDMCDPDRDSLGEARRRAEGLKYRVRFLRETFVRAPRNSMMSSASTSLCTTSSRTGKHSSRVSRQSVSA